MKVICIKDKGVNNVIKGGIYELVSIWDEHDLIRQRYKRNPRYYKRQMESKGITDHSHEYLCKIKGISSPHKIENFTKLDGTPLSPKPMQETRDQRMRNIKEGDILVCSTKKLKTLTYGKYYIAEELFMNKKRGDDVRVNNGRKYSIYNFDVVPKEKVREMNIDELMGGSEEMSIKTNNYDKLDHLEGTEDLLMLLEPLLSSLKYISDTNVENVSVLDVINKKYVGKSSLRKEDFDRLEKIDWNILLNNK